MVDWKVESLRLTLFRANPGESVSPNWETLTGESPEKVDSQPRAKLISESGFFFIGNLVYRADPIGINWILSPTEEQQQQATSFVALGPFSDIKNSFVGLFSDWLSSDSCPPINRIALGAVCISESANKEASYKALDDLLQHVSIDIENSTDFLYQINRPIESSVLDGVLINRLSKWSAMQTSSLGIILTGHPEIIQDQSSKYGCRLELDINTHQSNKDVIPKDKLVSLLDEFSRIGEDISSKGDQ
ncbi:MAG: hypothetical protein JW712_00250 [Dehalococcoidales bacterium]|nr:hypothetical protein [Dehalococcoidales bacterium]